MKRSAHTLWYSWNFPSQEKIWLKRIQCLRSTHVLEWVTDWPKMQFLLKFARNNQICNGIHRCTVWLGKRSMFLMSSSVDIHPRNPHIPHFRRIWFSLLLHPMIIAVMTMEKPNGGSAVSRRVLRKRLFKFFDFWFFLIFFSCWWKSQ